RGEDRDFERGARAVDQAQELVVAEHAVGAEDVELLRGRVPDAVRRRDREARALDVRQGPDRQAQDAVAPRILVEVVDAVAEAVRGDRPTGDGDDDKQDQEDPAADRDLVAPEAAPDLLPVPAGADLFRLAQLAVCLYGDGRRKPGL